MPWNDKPVTFKYAKEVARDSIREHIEWLFDNDGAIVNEVYTKEHADQLRNYLSHIISQIKDIKLTTKSVRRRTK